MEKYMKTLLLALHYYCICAEECKSPPNTNLTCYSDYNWTISCLWNSTQEHSDSVCTMHTDWKKTKAFNYNHSCGPVDFSRPILKKCSLIFNNKYRFQSFTEFNITLKCSTWNQSLIIPFKPVCNTKLNPPPKPTINYTTIIWVPQVTSHVRIKSFDSEVELRQQGQPWTQLCVHKDSAWDANQNITTNLPDDLIQHETYEARIRVKYAQHFSIWSDWSPTATWVSPIGEPKPAAGKDVVGSVLGTFACVVAVVISIILIKTDRTTWIYIVKRLRGPPLPNPAKSFLQDVNFQNLLNPHFTNESFHSILKHVEIVPVEVNSTLDAVTPRVLESTLREMMRSKSSNEMTSSSFSKPIYSERSPPPVSSLTAGNLEACDADTPYGPVGCHADRTGAEPDRDEERGKEIEILQLLSKGNSKCEPMPVISDYEKAEQSQVEHFRLQSLDSGVCSGEEVSQESLEADSVIMTNCHDDDGPEGNGQMKGESGEKVDLQKLFGGSACIFDKGSIQVCSGYEKVQKLQTDRDELHSLDSSVRSEGREQVNQEESPEDVHKPTESTGLLFTPPPPSSVLECSLPSFLPLPSNFPGTGLNALLPSHILDRIALMSTSRSMEPSGDGYMPVSQEHS